MVSVIEFEIEFSKITQTINQTPEFEIEYISDQSGEEREVLAINEELNIVKELEKTNKSMKKKHAVAMAKIV